MKSLILIALCYLSLETHANWRNTLKIQNQRTLECAGLLVDLVSRRVGREVSIAKGSPDSALVPQLVEDFKWRYGYVEYAPNIHTPFARRARGLFGQLISHPDDVRVFFYANLEHPLPFAGRLSLEFRYRSEAEKLDVFERIARATKAICDQMGCKHILIGPNPTTTIYAEFEDETVIRVMRLRPDDAKTVDGTSFSKDKAVHISVRPGPQTDAKFYTERVWTLLRGTLLIE